MSFGNPFGRYLLGILLIGIFENPFNVLVSVENTCKNRSLPPHTALVLSVDTKTKLRSLSVLVLGPAVSKELGSLSLQDGGGAEVSERALMFLALGRQTVLLSRFGAGALLFVGRSREPEPLF